MWCWIQREREARHTQDKWITTCSLGEHSLSKTESFDKFLVFDASEGFGETISQLLIYRNVFGSNCPIGEFFTNKVVAKLDVFAVLWAETIFDERDYPLVVNE